MANGYYYTTIRIEADSAKAASHAATVIKGESFARDMDFEDCPWDDPSSDGKTIDIRYNGYVVIRVHQITLLAALVNASLPEKCKIIVHEQTDSDYEETLLHSFSSKGYALLLHEFESIEFENVLDAAKMLKGGRKAAERLSTAFARMEEAADCQSAIVEILGVTELLRRKGFVPPLSHCEGWARKSRFLFSLNPDEVGGLGLHSQCRKMARWLERTALRVTHGNDDERRVKSL
ncbi:MAG: hypothetical protein WCL27_09020 [Betaproteobacteria bacterium]